MRFILLIVSCCFIQLTGSAQSINRFSIGASLSGLMTGSSNTSSSSNKINADQTFKQYADSVRSYETFRFSLGGSVWVNYFISKKWTLQTGVSYIDVGFQRNQENIKYLDPLYPGMGTGRLVELSGGSGEKSVNYDYRYQYLQIPAMVNYNFYTSPDFQYTLSFSAGLGLNILLDHRITATLNHFVVDGKDKFQFDSTGYNGRTVTFSGFIGAKGEYRMDKKTTLFVQPIISLSPISASTSPIRVYPWYIQLNAGIQYALYLEEKR